MIRVRRAALLALALAAISVAALAGGTVHEFIPADPKEDVLLGSTTPVGDLPAALETPSGLVSAPDPFRLPSPAERAYTRGQSPETSTFQPDRDTRRVPQVDYDDPFSPTLAPFKRLSAFDAINQDYSFRVADPVLRKVSVGGAAQSGEDPFYADLNVDLVPGEAVRIPSAGPGARILKAHTVPQTTIEVLRDGAENLFVRAGTRGRVRMLLHLAVPRASFGGPLRDALWGELPGAPLLPRNALTAAEDVNRSIGVSRAMAFRDVVDKLVAYYRSFVTTDEPLPGRGDVFLDVALAKKGVCRHRAFAFVVSALALRIPARLVTNEAHAWVEVNDGVLWHRIDLGGAADNFSDSSRGDRVPHQPPQDPFAWPPGSRSGRDMTGEANRPAPDGGAPNGGEAAGGSGSSSTGAGGGARTTLGDGGLPSLDAPGEDDGRPRATVRIASADREVKRNEALHLEGKVDSPAGSCAYVRVDVTLTTDRQEVPLGSLATDEAGQFQGAVVVPGNVTVGDYDIVLTTPGDARCGKGRSE